MLTSTIVAARKHINDFVVLTIKIIHETYSSVKQVVSLSLLIVAADIFMRSLRLSGAYLYADMVAGWLLGAITDA